MEYYKIANNLILSSICILFLLGVAETVFSKTSYVDAPKNDRIGIANESQDVFKKALAEAGGMF